MIYREVGDFHSTYAVDIFGFRLRQERFAFYMLVIFGVLCVPLLAAGGIGLFADDYILKAFITPWMIMSLAAMGLNILMGYCGQISLGAGAFMGIGAYAAYNIVLRLPGTPLPVAILLGGGTAAVIGVMFGLPSLRIKGLYLAVSTLAAQFFFDWFFLRVPWVTNNDPSGVVVAPAITVFGHPVQTAYGTYLFVLAFLLILATVVTTVVRGPLGRQWMAVRDMDMAAEMLGISPLYAKLTAFAFSSFLIGVAGALWAFVQLGSWDPLAFSIDRSFAVLFMIMVGGMGSLAGSFLGAGFMLILPALIEQLPHLFGIHLRPETVTNLTTLFIGVLIVVLLIREPHGFAKLLANLRERARLWPLRYPL